MKTKQILKAASGYSLWDVFFIVLRILRGLTVARMLALALTAGAVVFGLKYDVPQIARDMTIAVYAHRQAGDRIAFEPDYSMSAVLPSVATWGIEVNSTWLIEQITYTAPYFAMEQITYEPTYPDQAYFMPGTGLRSFVVGGQMFPASPRWNATGQSGGGTVLINERYLADPRWVDKRAVFATLVHELVHAQGGAFLLGAPESFESATSAATVETLAAMCLYENDLACKAFWNEIEGMALVSLATRLQEPAYDFFADLMIRDKQESTADVKNDRFWATHEAERRGIRERYGRDPWERHVIPGVVSGQRMSTANEAMTPKGLVGLYMPFDDTADLMPAWMRGWLWLIELMS